MYTIKINGQIVSVNKYKTTVAKSVKVSKVAFDFDESWDNLSIFACFRNANIGKEYTVQMTKPYEVDIPWEVLDVAGKLEVGALGLNANGIVKPTIWCTIADVVNGVSTDGIESAEPTQDIIVQITETADNAMNVANDAHRIATSVKQSADAGLFNGKDGVVGKDGVSPTFSVTDTDDGHKITIEDVNGVSDIYLLDGKDGYTPIKGVDYFDGVDGKDGADGYTPIKGKDYFDGADGKDGQDGKDGYTPQKGIDYFDGKDGADGKDGVSVTHSWDGQNLTITSASGTSSADLKGEQGIQGEKGKDGYTPVKGTDYFTEADKQELVNLVLSNFTNVSEVGQ